MMELTTEAWTLALAACLESAALEHYLGARGAILGCAFARRSVHFAAQLPGVGIRPLDHELRAGLVHPDTRRIERGDSHGRP